MQLPPPLQEIANLKNAVPVAECEGGNGTASHHFHSLTIVIGSQLVVVRRPAKAGCLDSLALALRRTAQVFSTCSSARWIANLGIDKFAWRQTSENA